MTTDTTSPAPAAGSFVDALADNRPRAAVILFALALAWAAAGGVGVYQYAKAQSAAKAADAEKEADPLSPDKKPADPNAGSHLFLALVGFVGAVTGAGFGVWLIAALPPPDRAKRLADVRTVCLLAGGLFGLYLMALGVWYFVDSYDTLSRWVSGGEADRAKKREVVYALLAFAAGAGLAFVAALPARAEERNNQTVRRLVYGSSVALTTLLLVMVLVIGNVLAAVKLPNVLDTTETGFNTLDPSTREFVAKLDRKVTVYALIPPGDQPWLQGTRNLLAAMQEVNPERFTVRFYGSAISRADRQSLKSKFPQADVDDYGLILAVGDDEKTYSYLRANDLLDQASAGMSRAAAAFQGEKRIVQELQFLTAGKEKSTLYFLQGNGELSIEPAGPDGGARQDRSAAQLRQYLEKANLTVKPLTLDATTPKVPDDAAAVVVLDPRQGVSPAAAAGLKAYMSEPRGDKKGKLIVAAGPNPVAGGGRVQPTGLADVLGGFNVTVRDEYLLSFYPPGTRPPTETIAGLTRNALEANNPIAVALETEPEFVLPLPRAIEVTPGGNPAVQATALFVTAVPTWVETELPADPAAVMAALLQQGAGPARQRKQATQKSRVVAAVASEGTSGRLLVVGSGQFFSDATARQNRGEANPAGRLMALAVDWLRERPVVAIASKPVNVYTPKPDMDFTRLILLPVGLMTLTVVGLGTGVWVARRK
jgi:hypothetical protein